MRVDKEIESKFYNSIVGIRGKLVWKNLIIY